MGRNILRQLNRETDRWTDPDAVRHRHDFDVPAVAVVQTASGHEVWHLVRKCRYCASFRAVPRRGSPSGIIPEEEQAAYAGHPKLVFQTDHKLEMAFRDIRLVQGEPEAETGGQKKM